SNAVLEILERNCVGCHNSHDQKGGVILDQHPVVADDLELILESVSGENPAMPKNRDGLTAEEIESIRSWVAAGARIPAGSVLQDTYLADKTWWSLQPVTKPELPGPDDWCENEVDRFVLAKLREKGLEPSEGADARTLVRRLTFDLTGLPPTPAEVERYLERANEDSDLAYAELVDRLLASPRYGEQWARHWLDVARYGESHGYDKDKARFNAWPYRDYVIRSLNEDKPWTRFVEEQIAGDVLWPGKPDGIVALGFIAAGPWDFISHHEVGEKKLDGRIAKHMDRDDMVSAVFNAFMSITVQCAQCHNHKFDPVSMEDYYRLQTVFAAVDRRDRVYDLDPELIRQRDVLSLEIGRLEGEVAAFDQAKKKEGGAELARLRTEISELETSGLVTLKTVPEHGYHSHISKHQSEGKWVQLEYPKPVEISRIELVGAYDDYAGIGAGFGFPRRYQVAIGKAAILDFTKHDSANPGIVPVSLTIGQSAKTIRITATKLAERKNDYIFALGEVRIFDARGQNIAATATITAKDSIEQGIRWGARNLVDGKAASGGNSRASQQLRELKQELQLFLTSLETPDQARRRSELTKLLQSKKKQLAELPEGKLVYSIATHFKTRGKVIATNGKPRPIHLLHRGDLNTPGEEMQPGAPALWEGGQPIFPLSEDHDEGDRRAALARYLTDPENPLLWRSIANRIWLSHFGRGIVDSPNDFGRMGMKPTHPELLDWLAVRLQETESLKDLHRLIVTSSTYRQSSANQTLNAKVDGGNTYYWRMNRRKLRAEEMRDSILAVAGKLDLRMGGPSFRDFNFKDDHTPKFWYHLHDPNDPNTHRRTIYRFIARSQTQPFLTTLDCADPSQMVAKRDETTTALQALVLMNNPFMTAMATQFAERLEPETDPIGNAIVLAFGRSVTNEESQMLHAYAEKHGLAATCRLIFNLNEFAYVD
ncbi:MAG: DUF1549 and DUF1553 domain-containing protein, partial [Verrucomicrobiota bacterium]